jgi:membrane peptidoglycan carboxypeptidase
MSNKQRLARESLPEPPVAPRAIMLQFGPHKFSVAVWIGEQDGQPVYYLLGENIREAAVAATVTRRLARELARPA